MKIPEGIPWKTTGTTLGEGAQGSVLQVYRKDGSDSTAYALKGLKQGAGRNAYERFAREVEAIKSIENDHVITIIDYSASETFPYYVMPYYDGAQSLHKVIATATANPYHENALEALKLFLMLLDAIGACENSKDKIIHRDIQPRNILRLSDGTIKLIDFGICYMEDGQFLTLLGEGVGARHYCAPECDSGVSGRASIASDLYSAGKVLWAAVTSRGAFAREQPVFENCSMQALFPLKRELWHLSEVFAGTIRTDPADRWHSTFEARVITEALIHLVTHGYLSVEAMARSCPICGWGSVFLFDKGFQIFHNPMPEGIEAIRCDHCGWIGARDRTILNATLKRRSGNKDGGGA